MDLSLTPKKTIEVDGAVVEEDALRIAEAINDYDPNLNVICLDPNVAGINDAPFMVIERCIDGKIRPVFSFWELDQRILDRVIAADRYQGNDAIAQIEAQEAAIKKEEHHRFEERRLEGIDLIAHIIGNRKSSFTFKNEEGVMVTINEHGRTEYDRGRSYHSK